jgi:hypothetical protein
MINDTETNNELLMLAAKAAGRRFVPGFFQSPEYPITPQSQWPDDETTWARRPKHEGRWQHVRVTGYQDLWEPTHWVPLPDASVGGD